MWPDDDIVDLIKGERPTLLEAEKGNELIKALNALRNITISRSQEDGVTYSDDEVAITYGMKFDFTGTVKVINPLDLSEMFVVSFSKGSLVSVTTEASGWQEKEITICEDGSPVAYTFVVKS